MLPRANATVVRPRFESKVTDNGGTDNGHQVMWVVLGGGVCLSLMLAILAMFSVIARSSHEVPPEPREPPWVAVQTTEQINDLKEQVEKLKETIDAQQGEIQRLRTEVQTAHCMIQEVKNPTPVGHAGPVLIQGGK